MVPQVVPLRSPYAFVVYRLVEPFFRLKQESGILRYEVARLGGL